MVRYIFDATRPSTQYFTVTIHVEDTAAGILRLRMPAWRPGRYELGQFIKNIRSVKAFDAAGAPLVIIKTARDQWEIENPGGGVKIVYELYAALLNAGSTYLDEVKFQVNPVNACMMVEDFYDAPHAIEFLLPGDWLIGTGLPKNGNAYGASNFDRLADSPILGGKQAEVHKLPAVSAESYAWFFGVYPSIQQNPAVNVLNDIARIVDFTTGLFGHFPEKDYHFLFQVTPYRSHHGVEHENSTVIMLGPSFDLFGGAYVEFLALVSHEFYHTWNIKKLRPAEMHPYDLTRENYSRLGFVAEGVTTYYGDLNLSRAGLITPEIYFTLLAEELNKHFHNYGRFNQPVAEASFDTWIDGYEPGIPHKKTSIYTEGALLALAADLMIIKNSGGQWSLDDAMKYLYHEFALKGKGYTMQDYRRALEKYTGEDLGWYFEEYVNGTGDYKALLDPLLSAVGCEIIHVPNPKYGERTWGIRLAEEQPRVLAVAPGSPAETAGFMYLDIVMEMNGVTVDKNFHAWAEFFAGKETIVTVKNNDRIRQLIIMPDSSEFYPVYQLAVRENLSESEAMFLKKWANIRLS